MADSVLSDNLVYSSPRIFERRRRILWTARDLVAKHGYEGFSVRELCKHAGVAPHTVYKAFESKERVVALSIREYFLSFIQKREFVFDKTSLQGVIERLIVSDLHMHDARTFVSAIVAIYFSQTADEDLQIASRMNIIVTLQPWAEALRERGHLRVGVTVDDFVRDIVGLLFDASLNWCRGKISDENFGREKLRMTLTYASGATRGAGRKEIDLHLTDLLGKRALIGAIQMQVDEVEKREALALKKAEDSASTDGDPSVA